METTGSTIDNEAGPLQASRVANEINDRNMSLNACINQIVGSMLAQSNMVGRVTVVVAATVFEPSPKGGSNGAAEPASQESSN